MVERDSIEAVKVSQTIQYKMVYKSRAQKTISEIEFLGFYLELEKSHLFEVMAKFSIN